MTMVQNASCKILALDTATSCGSVALLEGTKLISEVRICSLETHSARLLRSMQFLFDSSGWGLRDLNLVAAGIGPGSFTGIRIGIATALGLAQTLGIFFAGASGLDALASHVTLPKGRLGVVLDAQRSQVYYAEYEASKNCLRRIVNPGLWYPEDLKTALVRGRLYLAGDGAARYISKFRPNGREFPKLLETDPFIAASIGRLALAQKRTWRSGEELKCDPLYIRPPDAKKPRGSR